MQLTDKLSFEPTISPDGKLIACKYLEDDLNGVAKIAILPFDGGPPTKLLDLPANINYNPAIRWTVDGSALTYSDLINGVSNLWNLPLAGGPPKQLTNFKSDTIWAFDWSRDGKKLVIVRGHFSSNVVLIRNFK